MRGTTDIYAKLSLAENASCDVHLVVTYEDDTTKTYTVKLDDIATSYKSTLDGI